MSEETVEKYFVINTCNEDNLNKRMNDAFQQGYKCHTFSTQYEQGEHPGLGSTRFIALMSLSSTVDLSKAVNMVNVDLDKNTEDGTILFERYKEKGWTAIANYSKHVTMVKNGD